MVVTIALPSNILEGIVIPDVIKESNSKFRQRLLRMMENKYKNELRSTTIALTI